MPLSFSSSLVGLRISAVRSPWGEASRRPGKAWVMDSGIRIVRVERGEGAPIDEIGAMLGSGWKCIPKASIHFGIGAIAVPGAGTAPTGTEVADVWYLPAPMVPAGYVIATLQELGQREEMIGVVDWLAHHLLNSTAEAVLAYGQGKAE
jgi:hypothetical protein